MPNSATSLPFWQRTIPLLNTPKDKWEFILSLSLYTSLFLIIFQPFGVNNYDPTHQLSLIFVASMIGFGLVNGLTMGLYEFGIAPFLFRRNTLFYFSIRIGLAIFLLAVSTFLYYNFLGNFHDWNWASFWGFVRDVSFMGLIPFGIYFLWAYAQQYRKEYSRLIEQIPSSEPALIWLSDDNGKDQIALKSHQLLFVQAQDNYVAVNYLENGSLKKKLLRTPIKKLAAELATHSIIRCHRSFLVNVRQIKQVNRRAHRLQVYLSDMDQPIPVSRSYLPKMEQALAIRPS